MFFLSHLEMDLLVCLGSLSCCIELEVTKWWLDILLKDFLIECRFNGSINHGKPQTSHYHHHVWLLVWCPFDVMLCWFYARCNRTHTFQKVWLSLHQSTEYLPKRIGDNQDIFWQMWDEPVFFLIRSDDCLWLNNPFQTDKCQLFFFSSVLEFL